MLMTTEQLIPTALPAVPAALPDNDALAAWLNGLPADIAGDPRRTPWAGELWGDGSQLLVWCERPQPGDHVAALLGYWFKSAAAMPGEWAVDSALAAWAAASGRLFLVWCDTTKSPRDDFGDALEVLPGLLEDGSPVRKTNRTGPQGTQAVAGLRGRVCWAWR